MSVLILFLTMKSDVHLVESIVHNTMDIWYIYFATMEFNKYIYIDFIVEKQICNADFFFHNENVIHICDFIA